jgi:peptidoglycan/xylan/chitin deacetylase (PgdA/CDA1 family)
MPKLTLSFDNGPTPGVTERVLDELARRRLKATFFLIGKHLARPGARALAERARSEGHWIGNHTMHHETPLGRILDDRSALADIEDAQALLSGLVDPRKLFRPYAGGGELGPHLLSRTAADHLAENAYTVVIWNSVPGDWKAPYAEWGPKALADIKRQDWTFLVLHDIRPELADALPDFLDRLGDLEIVQDFPPACVLMQSGRATCDLSGLVTN